MPFVKGQQSANPIGRPKGAKDKRNLAHAKALEKLILAYEKDKLVEDFNSLPPRERMRAYESLLSYIRPKLKQTDSNINSTLNVIQFSLPAQLNPVIDIEALPPDTSVLPVEEAVAPIQIEPTVEPIE